MAMNVAQKLIAAHLIAGQMQQGEEISLKIDQTLCQDATGTLVMLELEAIGLERIKTSLSVQYVDHNLIQEDYKNPDDHLFLQSAAQRFGLWFSRPGNGVSHPLHMEYFGQPGLTLIGSDSHTCAGGALGMLAIGVGGLEVAMAIAGHPLHIKMPSIMGVHLTGQLPEWVSAKDIILEMLRRHSVKGGVGSIIEYYGQGLKTLSVWDRHVIANMGAELGATTSVFPADEITKQFLQSYGREDAWQALVADEGATYDRHDEIDLSTLEPLIALPSNPDHVVKVREIAGREVYQAYIGSSANPSYRDFAIAALMMDGKTVHSNVSLDINPASRGLLEALARDGHLTTLLHCGARLHQAGCNGCIGMGQAPATGRNSLRTVPRNFPGRSGTLEDSVYLCSPETAIAAAITGKITDPRDLLIQYPVIHLPEKVVVNKEMLQAPLETTKNIALVKGPNIHSIPALQPFPEHCEVKILLAVGDNISTDAIMPAGARVLPYRSNIPKISEFVFDVIDDTYAKRARNWRDQGNQHAIVGGENYGQGSSREHAALAPRYLGLQLVIAKSFARIHWENLINFGILPLTYAASPITNGLQQDDTVTIEHVLQQLRQGNTIQAKLLKHHAEHEIIPLTHTLSTRQIDILAAGGLINWAKQQY